MKKLLMIAGLLITLCNVGAGVVYACFCIDKYDTGAMDKSAGSTHMTIVTAPARLSRTDGLSQGGPPRPPYNLVTATAFFISS
jgi:hypothetical protein